jgi:beta-phosphoglucomutase-like phosphatase (HAD superfamily)
MRVELALDCGNLHRLLAVSGRRSASSTTGKPATPETRAIDSGAIEDLIERLHLVKTAACRKAVQDGHAAMRPGVLDLIHEAAQAGLKLAIATTTSPVNISALLRRVIGEEWRKLFAVVEDASTAHLEKPHPMVSCKPCSDCACRLKIASPLRTRKTA